MQRYCMYRSFNDFQFVKVEVDPSFCCVMNRLSIGKLRGTMLKQA